MSQAPYLLNAQARWGYRLGDGTLTDVILQDGLLCATHGYPMGITAENIAREYDISREMQDALALLSQQKALAAIHAGAFRAEIVPVSVTSRKKLPSLSATNSPKPTPRRKDLPPCARRSIRRAASPPVTPQGSTTARRRWW